MNYTAGGLALVHLIAHVMQQIPPERIPDVLKMFAETFKKQTTLADLVIFVFLVLYTFNQ
jgi:hypothetical protein